MQTIKKVNDCIVYVKNLKKHKSQTIFLAVLFSKCCFWYTVLHLSKIRFLPTTVSRNAKLILGSVDTWHSYAPESRGCAGATLSVQISDPSVCSAANRASLLYVWTPTVRICRSRLRIHDTWWQQNNFSLIFYCREEFRRI